jgi:hypothetical protein
MNALLKFVSKNDIIINYANQKLKLNSRCLDYASLDMTRQA